MLMHTSVCAIRIAALNMAHWSLRGLSVSGTRESNETASVAATKLVAPNAKESAHAILGSAQLHELKLDDVELGSDQHASSSTMKQSFATKAQRMTHTQIARQAYTEKQRNASIYRLYIVT